MYINSFYEANMECEYSFYLGCRDCKICNVVVYFEEQEQERIRQEKKEEVEFFCDIKAQEETEQKNLKRAFNKPFFHNLNRWNQEELRIVNEIIENNYYLDDDLKDYQILIKAILSGKCFKYGIILLSKHIPTNTYEIDDIYF